MNRPKVDQSGSGGSDLGAPEDRASQRADIPCYEGVALAPLRKPLRYRGLRRFRALREFDDLRAKLALLFERG